MDKYKFVFDFRVIIHTIQMKSEIPYIDANILDEINNKAYIIKHNARPTKNGYLFPINANKLNNIEICSLSDFLTAITCIKLDLDISEWNFNRVDFAFDTKLKYDNIYKHSLYVISLLSAVTGIKNAIDIQDINTKKKRALTLKNANFEFQIYDKALESDNKYPYSRFEFRFKNLRNADIYSLLERLKHFLCDLSFKIETIDEQRISDLYALWKKERKVECTTQIKNFSEFIRRYSNNIFTRNIIKELYHKICGGNFDNWLKKFRGNNKINFITKSEIKTITENMIIALNKYIG